MSIDNLTKDGDGHVIGCPHCGARSLRKDGFNYYAKNKKQVWYCNSCCRKTLRPTIVEENPFSVEDRDPDSVPIDELIAFRQKQFKIKKSSKDNRKLVNIDIHMDGPIGIAHFGDPHVDDDGTDLSQILSYISKINNTDGMFAGNLGDLQYNWIG